SRQSPRSAERTSVHPVIREVPLAAAHDAALARALALPPLREGFAASVDLLRLLQAALDAGLEAGHALRAAALVVVGVETVAAGDDLVAATAGGAVVLRGQARLAALSAARRAGAPAGVVPAGALAGVAAPGADVAAGAADGDAGADAGLLLAVALVP